MGPRSNWNIDIAEMLARIDSMDPGGATADAAEIRRIMNAARAIAVRLLLRFDQMDGLAGVGAVAADAQGTALGKRVGEVADRLSSVVIAVDAASGDLAASVAARPTLLATAKSGGDAAAAQVARARVMQRLYSDPMSARSDGLAAQSGSPSGVGGPALGPLPAGAGARTGGGTPAGTGSATLPPVDAQPAPGAPVEPGQGGRPAPADPSTAGGAPPTGGPTGAPIPGGGSPGGPAGAPAGTGPTGSPPVGAPPVAAPPPSTVPARPPPGSPVRSVPPLVGSTLRLPGVPAAPSPGAANTATAPPVRPLGSPTAGPTSAVPSGRGNSGSGAGPLGAGGVRGAEEDKRRRPGYLLSSLEFARLVGPMPVAGPAVLGEPEPAPSDVAVDDPAQIPTDDDDQELDLTL